MTIPTEETKEEELSIDERVEQAEAAVANGNATPATEETVKVVDDDEEDEDGSKEDDVDENNKKKKTYMKVAADAPWKDRMWEVFSTFWPLGLIAFGGPQAHVAILRDHLVIQRDWLDEEQFMELFAIGQGLPGPTSTQLVVSAALARAGPLGGIMAFVLWTLPGLIFLTLCGVLIEAYIDPDDPPFYLAGLPPAAISLVFEAFYSFAIVLDSLGVCLALMSCLVAILINNDADIDPTSGQWVFPVTLAIGGIVTFVDSKRKKPFSTYSSPSKGWDKLDDDTIKRIGIPLWVGGIIFLIWIVVLIVMILLVGVADLESDYLEIFETMYRIGCIIFGGGQVVLPMLQDEVVPDWMTNDQYLQGLGLSQSMPGPLFNFSAYLGAVYKGVPGALLGYVGLFSPGIILIFAMVPFWARLRHNANFKAVLKGVNATAIGLVGAACVTLWESAIVDAADAMVFCVALTLAVYFNVPAPFCILAGGIVGAILHPDALDLGQVPYCIDQGFLPPADEIE